jgi:SpoVK/Ycf46/Vps4 family AAA+-type ATPase
MSRSKANTSWGIEMDHSVNKPLETDNILRHLRASARPDDICDLPANIRRSLSYIVIDSRVQALADRPTRHSFSKSGSRLGVSALFAGASGTGKTMAAQLLANQLSMDVCRVNLARFVNKHIGETEKNLTELFEKAEAKNYILLLDEGEVLLGSRTDVKLANDRYANQEISYLLRCMENHWGIVILSSSSKDNLNPAHLRRFQYILDFDSDRKTNSPSINEIRL